MKKYLYIITALLLGAGCAQKEQLSPDPVAQTEDGKVTIEMNVTIPGSQIVTKGAMGKTPEIDNIYVAVFGGSHFLNEYALAVPVDDNGNIVTENGKLKYGNANGTPYKLRVTLTATESKRYIHVIANGPAQMDYMTTENDLMKNLTTTDNQGAYWQSFEVDGLGKRNEETDAYEPTASATSKFGDIQLIRNFALIDVQVASSVTNFQLLGFRVFNTPAEGTVAMFKKEIDSTKENYQNYSEWVETTEYAAMKVGGNDATKDLLQNGFYAPFMKGGITPETAADYSATTYHAPGNPFFVYECPDGDEAAGTRAYIILYGKYGNNDPSYYRIELVDDEGKGFPIYRNFDYTITLTAIAKNGEEHAADTRPSNVNISSSFSAENLSDISDGISRLYVQYLAKTFAGSEVKYAFRYMYLPDATDETTATAATLTVPTGSGISIYVNGNEEDDLYDPLYKDAETAEETWTTGGQQITSGANRGWYEVYFTVNGGSKQTSTFTVTGSRTNASGKEVKLFRNITIDVLSTLTLDGEIKTYGTTVGSPVDLILTLDEGLPSSMFPIEFQISDSNGCLNPRSNDMPSGIDEENHGYYFTRTVNWSDYFVAATDDQPASYNTEVLCRLKRISTGTSTVYVKHPYFTTWSAELPAGGNVSNYLVYEGDDPIVVKATDLTATLSFMTDQAWTASASDDATVNPANGTNNGTITVTLPSRNSSLEEAVDYTVTITTTGTDPKTQEITIHQLPLAEHTYTLMTNNTTLPSGTTYTSNNITVTFGEITNNGRNADFIQFNTNSDTAANRRYTVTSSNGRILKSIIPTYSRNSAIVSTDPGTYADGKWATDNNNIDSVQFNHSQTNNNNQRSRLSSLEVTVLE